jgi:hypothetical protein
VLMNARNQCSLYRVHVEKFEMYLNSNSNMHTNLNLACNNISLQTMFPRESNFTYEWPLHVGWNLVVSADSLGN